MAKANPTVHLTHAQRAELALAHRSAVVVGIVFPAVTVAIGIVLMCVWLPRVPTPMASHWGSGGGPDGFTQPVLNLIFAAVTLVGVLALMTLCVLLQRRPSQVAVWSSMHRFMPAFSAATMVFLMVVLVGTWQIQLDVLDATRAGSIGTVMGVAVCATIVSGMIAWLVQPRVRIDAPNEARATPLTLAQGETAAWVATVKPGQLFLGIIVPVLALTGGIAVWLFALQEPSWWISGLTTLLIVMLIATTCVFHVSVTERGLVARSALGWPVFRVTPDEVQRVVACDINPLAEFGGIGLRWAPGRVGLVYRSGEGIMITKTNGHVFAVTVDDAETGAALLATYAEQRNDPLNSEA